ncbi:MAG: hypothetical protein CVV46_14180 [Spirochaetae bacterium HGW-Spirochaetae-2]|jgi:DNA processing protein|nr:MAG: hypothetical protein CVV46_14180 [Spirochaetae bacterium HGW-Spirochaetae-2]
MRDTTSPVYWVWLHELQGLSPISKRKLLKALGNPRDIFQASLQTIVSIVSKEGLSTEGASLVAERKSIGVKLGPVWSSRDLRIAEAILTANGKGAIGTLCAHDVRYRHIFESDSQSPLVLYYRGTLAPPEVPVLGIIGSRACTAYGRMVTVAAVTEAVGKGQVVASGLSFGIDALAHQTSLEQGGTTYAFVPCGLHKAQPASHAALFEHIADSGAVITPYAYGKEALPFRFIGRNGLLATWCDTLLVIESGGKGGSMNTARSALAKGKRVLAVPNSLLEPRSWGTNQLLVEGAKAYLNEKLLRGDTDHRPASGKSAHGGEGTIIGALRDKAMATSEIVLLVGDSGCAVMEYLTDMELADKLEFRSDGKWHLVGGP